MGFYGDESPIKMYVNFLGIYHRALVEYTTLKCMNNKTDFDPKS